MARLILESGGERREYAVHGPLTLGRGKTAEIQLEDKLLSREHTRVEVDRNGNVTVRDLDSKNGTFLNGDLIRRIEVLSDGDKIKLGPFVLRFVSENAGPKSAPKKASPPREPAKPRANPAMAGLRAALMRKRGQDGEEGGIGGGGILLFLVAMIVFAAGTYASKLVFVWAFNRAFPG